jgi:hypothetical protein
LHLVSLYHNALQLVADSATSQGVRPRSEARVDYGNL